MLIVLFSLFQVASCHYNHGNCTNINLHAPQGFGEEAVYG